MKIYFFKYPAVEFYLRPEIILMAQIKRNKISVNELILFSAYNLQIFTTFKTKS